MRVVLQRVARARVAVEGETVAAIGRGLLLLVGFAPGDGEEALRWMAGKVISLRIFPDDRGLMNRDLAQTAGEVLVVSQFTLYGDTRRGRRPSFVGAAPPEEAEPLYRAFVERLGALVPGRVATGVFGAAMAVELVNDGPVTLVLER
ncbi:MAG: D-aminoacyl-tRNA deacylase [Longimicrobiales bacterium]|nr:D-aminoacyl-tRNA deacylase [Longimicrobiales bacterium]